MSIPTYDKFIEPVLRYLASHPEGVRAGVAQDAAADALQLSVDDRQILLPSGNQPVYKNRAGWAHDRLKRAGLSSSPRRGFWQLTEKGNRYASEHPGPLSPQQTEELALGFTNVRLRSAAVGDGVLDSDLPVSVLVPDAVASPDDRLGQALSELREAVANELLETLARVSPSFFESIVLDVLHRMGYGES